MKVVEKSRYSEKYINSKVTKKNNEFFLENLCQFKKLS